MGRQGRYPRRWHARRSQRRYAGRRAVGRDTARPGRIIGFMGSSGRPRRCQASPAPRYGPIPGYGEGYPRSGAERASEDLSGRLADGRESAPTDHGRDAPRWLAALRRWRRRKKKIQRLIDARGRIVNPGDPLTSSRGEEYIYRFISQPRGGGSGGKIIVYPAHVEDAITKMQAYWETGDESMLDALQEYNEWKFTDLELDEIRRQVDPEDQQDYLDYVRQTMFTREFYPSVFDAELEVPELEVKKAGGGKIKKGLSRRDFLKGAAAAGATGALGAGVIGTKKGAADVPVETVARAAAAPRRPYTGSFMKQDMDPDNWAVIDSYLEDHYESLLDEIRHLESELFSGRIPQNTEAGQITLRQLEDVQAEAHQVDFILGADPDYRFTDVDEDYLVDFLGDTASDKGLEIEDYGDWDDLTDGNVRDYHTLENAYEDISGLRDRFYDDADEMTEIREALGRKPEMAGGGSVKKALQRLQNARRALEQESDPDIELIGRSLMQDEDPTLRNVGQRIVRNEARVANQEMSFEEAQKYYERISRLLDEAGARLGEWFKDGRPDPGD